MRYLILFLSLCFFYTPSEGQASSDEDHPDELSAHFQGLKFRNIGPYRGGRSNCVSGVVGDPLTYYMGTVGGGVYKTENAGNSWENITDGQLETGSVGAIAVSESDPNVIYVGMGEHAVRGVMSSYGDGVYKSNDAGKTWNHIGLPESRHISRIRIHPENPDVVYIAAQGALFGPNKERGIYRSLDGGNSWEQVLFVDEGTGASDISMDMTNPRILYASMWDYQRYPWKVRSGGDGSGIYKSLDGGNNWEKLEKGLPKKMGKVAVDVSRANPQVVYANIEADKSGVYKSTDGGKNWRLVCDDRITITRSWYYIEIYADPVNENIVYVMNAPFLRSIDGGKTFSTVRVPHGDQHDLWINPDDNTNMINANDGGANVTFDNAGSWTRQDNQVTAQFYRVITDNQFPYRVYGGQQDNSTVSIASRTNSRGIGNKDWHRVAGGESAFIAFDENDPQRVYGGSYQGNISFYDVNTQITKDIMAYPVIGLGTIPKDMKYRFNWNAPIIACPQDPSIIYHGGNHVLKSEDSGISWSEISPDLTRNDKSRQGPGGEPYTNEGAGGENYNTISYMVSSEHNQGTLLVGTDDGLVHVTSDDGVTWTDITPEGLEESLINSIEVSPHDASTIYLSVTRYKWNDLSPMIFKSTDMGESWTKMNEGIHPLAYVRAVREDKKVKGLLYAGTERGLYVRFPLQSEWMPMQLNLPVSPINDLTIRDNDLVVATSGRAFWILDDLSAIQGKAKMGEKMAIVIFAPKPSYRYGYNSPSRAFSGVGQNPLPGVILDYVLTEDMDSSIVSIDIMDNSGEIIRSYSSKKDMDDPQAPLLSTKKGVNRMSWNMRKKNLPKVKGLRLLQNLGGHAVCPGNYSARLAVDGDTSFVDITIKAYPGIEASQDEYEEQYEFLNSIEDVFTDVHLSVEKMYKIKGQLKNQKELLKDHKDLVALGDSTVKEIDGWIENLVQPKQKTFQDIINFTNQLNAELIDLKSRTDGMYPQVTAGSKQRFQDLMGEWTTHRQAMNAIIEGPLQSYNNMYVEKGIPAIIMPGEE
ncbi:MAG: glycosyl hydrolase [Saprospiraceae bacterium]|nr:glycosyl hydrolase [Saprospiraceae bacterium]